MTWNMFLLSWWLSGTESNWKVYLSKDIFPSWFSFFRSSEIWEFESFFSHFFYFSLLRKNFKYLSTLVSNMARVCGERPPSTFSYHPGFNSKKKKINKQGILSSLAHFVHPRTVFVLYTKRLFNKNPTKTNHVIFN